MSENGDNREEVDGESTESEAGSPIPSDEEEEGFNVDAIQQERLGILFVILLNYICPSIINHAHRYGLIRHLRRVRILAIRPPDGDRFVACSVHDTFRPEVRGRPGRWPLLRFVYSPLLPRVSAHRARSNGCHASRQVRSAQSAECFLPPRRDHR